MCCFLTYVPMSFNSKCIFVQVNELDFPGHLNITFYDIVSPYVKPCVQILGSENFSIATNVFKVKMKHFKMKLVTLSHYKCGALLLLLLLYLF